MDAQRSQSTCPRSHQKGVGLHLEAKSSSKALGFKFYLNAPASVSSTQGLALHFVCNFLLPPGNQGSESRPPPRPRVCGCPDALEQIRPSQLSNARPCLGGGGGQGPQGEGRGKGIRFSPFTWNLPLIPCK